MSVLIISESDKPLIKKMIEHERANVIPWSELEGHASATDTATLKLSERPADFKRRASSHMMLGTYLVALSFEEQPAGIFKHISVSSHNPQAIPGPHVMEMIAEAFAFSGVALQRAGRVWIEEFEPGHYAVNIIELEP